MVLVLGIGSPAMQGSSCRDWESDRRGKGGGGGGGGDVCRGECGGGGGDRGRDECRGGGSGLKSTVESVGQATELVLVHLQVSL